MTGYVDSETHEGIVARLERERKMERERAERAEAKLQERNQELMDAREHIKGLVSKCNRLAERVPFWEPYASE